MPFIQAKQISIFAMMTHCGKHSSLSSITGLLKMIGVNIDPQVLENLNLGELLNSPPPGFDEVLAIAKISTAKQ